MKYDIAIIGAGASGMLAAITAAEHNKKVCILEAEDRIGKKILATGNGKCNLTNLKLSEECYRSSSGEGIMPVIEAFDNQAVIDFFYGKGLLTRDREGYVYPYSEQAASVLDTLRRELDAFSVVIKSSCSIKGIEKKNNFLIKMENGENVEADALILATGSAAGLKKHPSVSGYTLAKAMGHGIIKPLPSLVQLICKESFFKEITGVRAKASVKLFVDGKLICQDRGELQLTDYGISGIPVFQISRYAVKALDEKRKKVEALIDFMPEHSLEEVSSYIEALFSRNPALPASEVLTGLIHKKLMLLMLKLADIKPNLPVKEGQRTQYARFLAGKIKSFQVQVTGSKGIENAQVCQGGIPLSEINCHTMESKLVKNLYFCGELLDVDGICGGYNLQWAWSSGYLAGKHAACKKEK